MGRLLVGVSALLVLCIGGLALAVYLTRSEDRLAVDNLLSEDISRAIGTAEERGDGTVDLTEVARFPWTEVLLVGRDVPREAISDALGSEWKGDVNFGYGELLIFLNGGRVTRFADYRGEGRFVGFERPIERLGRERARFRVRGLVISP